MRWIVMTLAVLLTLLSASIGISHPAFGCEHEREVEIVQPEDLGRSAWPCAGPDRINQDGKSFNATTGDCDGAPGAC